MLRWASSGSSHGAYQPTYLAKTIGDVARLVPSSVLEREQEKRKPGQSDCAGILR